MKRCPECGTIVTPETQTCGVCGTDLANILDQPIETAASEEERVEATDEARVKRKDIAEARRYQYLRLTMALAGVSLWVIAIVTYPLGPELPFRFGLRVPIVNLTLVTAGLASIMMALEPWNLI